jgi:exonuclease III
LQETHISSSEYIDELSNIFSDYFCYFTKNFDKTRGVGILINKFTSHDINILNTHYDLESRFLRIEIKIEKQYINLINIYAPNVEKEQFEFINKMYDVCAGVKNIILGGDFNAVAKARDRIGSKVSKLKKFELEWNLFVRNLNLIECDYGKKFNLEEKMTWSNGIVSSRIDKIFYDKDIMGNILYNSIKETCKSDHKAVFASLQFNNNFLSDRDKNKNDKPEKYIPWRLNDEILEDKSVIEGVNEICGKIQIFKEKYEKIEEH